MNDEAIEFVYNPRNRRYYLNFGTHLSRGYGTEEDAAIAAFRRGYKLAFLGGCIRESPRRPDLTS